MADYIKRSDAIEAIENRVTFRGVDSFIGDSIKQACSSVIRFIPSVDIPQWVSVKERLPEEGRYVLVAYETIAGYLCHVSMLWTYATGDYYWDGLHGINPTHWMPLPEEPKEET